MKNILLILTGGTICSFADNGIRNLKIKDAERLLIKNYKDSNSIYANDVKFTENICLDTFSENMDVKKLSILVDSFKNSGYMQYDGVIIAHGTDTLAYTAALFALLTKGIQIPVVFVSANAPLDHKDSNGNENFRTAADGILSGNIPNGVWVAYQNISDGRMHIHNGFYITQCPKFSDDFESINSDIIPVKKDMLINEIKTLSNGILYIAPYVGIDYNVYNMKNVRAVLHGTYHSGTVESVSFSQFAKKCIENDIPVLVSPCEYGCNEVYSTVPEALSTGAVNIYGMTNETVYCKMLIAFSLYSGKDAIEFIKN